MQKLESALDLSLQQCLHALTFIVDSLLVMLDVQNAKFETFLHLAVPACSLGVHNEGTKR